MFLDRYWTQIRTYLNELSPSQKWLIGAIVIILLFTAFFVVQYAGAPERVPITQFASSRQPEVISRLRSAGIEAEEAGGQVTVPVGELTRAHAVLAEADMLAADTSQAFKELIANQTPWLNSKQNEQAAMIATQQVLGQIIAKMKDVRSADVIISKPEHTGFGRTYNKPSASVNVVMRGSHSVQPHLVEAVAGLVSGSVAELTPAEVTVIDANRGRYLTVDSPEEASVNSRLRVVKELEESYHRKIMAVLRYIPEVIVAVSVQTDSIQSRESKTYTLDKTEPLLRQRDTEIERRDVGTTGAPGVGSNTGADIEAGASSGRIDKETTSESDYGPKALTGQEHTRFIGQATEKVNVTVNVPRSYFVRLYRQRNPGEQEEPDDATLKPIVDPLLEQIETQVKPLVEVKDTAGIVTAAMVFDGGGLPFGGTDGAEAGAGVADLLGSNVLMPGLLAVISMALAFFLFKKGVTQPVLPTIEELAGVPPTLPGDEELIGEAETHDTSMSGIEVSDEELRIRKMTEQIAELVSTSPAEAGTVLKRWVEPDE